MSRPGAPSGSEAEACTNGMRSSQDIDLPSFEHSGEPHPWNEVNEKQLRSALVGACKRMSRNAEAHFHLGLMYMRRCDGEEALRAFQQCSQIYSERLKQYARNMEEAPAELRRNFARLKSHTAQAAHLAASTQYSRDERAPLLEQLQKDLVAATNLDTTQPDIWNALGLLHLNEGGFEGSRDVLRTITETFPEYLDALNNLGLSELALGNAEEALSCFQKVIVLDRGHAEALSNYGLVLLQHGMYESASRAFEAAVKGSSREGRGLSFAWGGLAISHAAIGKFTEAEEAAVEADRAADPVNRPKFSVLMTSIKARRVTVELRKGVASDMAAKAGNLSSMGPADMPLMESESPEDPRPALDQAVLRLRSLARDIGTSSASTALGAVLRLRHDYAYEETGNRNFGAESAERLVEALEKDESDASAWVQLALLQLGTGRYTSSKDFSVQAVSRNNGLEAAWNSLAVSSQLSDNIDDSLKAYTRAVEAVAQNYGRGALQEDALAGASGLDARSDRRGAMDVDDVTPAERPNGLDGNEQSALTGVFAEKWSGKTLNKAGLNALAVIYCNLGNLKRQDGQSFAEAQEAYKKSLDVGGENAAVYNNLALLYISAKRFDDAERMLDHALKLQPHFECALSNQLKLRALMQQGNGTDSDDMAAQGGGQDVDETDDELMD